MRTRKFWSAHVLLLLVILPACAPFLPTPLPTPVPGFVNTVVVLTAQAASAQTASALPPATATSTPTSTIRPITATPTPTATVLFTYVTSTSTTPTIQPPPPAWPAWDTGEIVRMPSGSGENVGKTKFFSVLQYVKVRVIRKNGVKVRQIPSTSAVSNMMVEYGDTMLLLGLWNHNNNNSYVKVRLPDGKEYWVGGNGDSTPQVSLEFVQ